MMNIYRGNLPYRNTEDELHELFATNGEVNSANIIMDRESGKAKGLRFIKMLDKEFGEAAVESLNQTDVQGRSARLNEARPRNDNRGGRR